MITLQLQQIAYTWLTLQVCCVLLRRDYSLEVPSFVFCVTLVFFTRFINSRTSPWSFRRRYDSWISLASLCNILLSNDHCFHTTIEYYLFILRKKISGQRPKTYKGLTLRFWILIESDSCGRAERCQQSAVVPEWKPSDSN